MRAKHAKNMQRHKCLMLLPSEHIMAGSAKPQAHVYPKYVPNSCTRMHVRGVCFSFLNPLPVSL